MADRVILSIGTRKGVVARAAKPRRSFALRGLRSGRPVYSHADRHARHTAPLPSSCNPFFGMKVLRSTDMGKSFKETKSAPAFPKEDGRALANIWSLEPGGGKKSWCGVGQRIQEPGRRRFVGRWCPASAITSTARKWQPGAGGLCMHTIIRDGNRVHLAISTGGHLSL